MIHSDKNLVLANQLVKGRYQLTKEEQNFIYLMVSQINKDDTKFTEYQIHIKELENAELTQKQYGRYREFAKSLLSKVITIEDEKEILTANWFSSLKYINLIFYSSKKSLYKLSYQRFYNSIQNTQADCFYSLKAILIDKESISKIFLLYMILKT